MWGRVKALLSYKIGSMLTDIGNAHVRTKTVGWENTTSFKVDELFCRMLLDVIV